METKLCDKFIIVTSNREIRKIQTKLSLGGLLIGPEHQKQWNPHVRRQASVWEPHIGWGGPGGRPGATYPVSRATPGGRRAALDSFWGQISISLV